MYSGVVVAGPLSVNWTAVLVSIYVYIYVYTHVHVYHYVNWTTGLVSGMYNIYMYICVLLGRVHSFVSQIIHGWFWAGFSATSTHSILCVQNACGAVEHDR